MTSAVSMHSLEEGAMNSSAIGSGQQQKMANGGSTNGLGNIPRKLSNSSCNPVTTNNNTEEVRAIPIAVEPPDGGYGWVVVFASFMCNLTVDGKHLHYFNISYLLFNNNNYNQASAMAELLSF